MDNCGAELGVGYGFTGHSFALPTKDINIETLPINMVKLWVEWFVLTASRFPKLRFFVTRVGCGLAGFTDEQIATMFVGATENCIFPIEWEKFLERGKTNAMHG